MSLGPSSKLEVVNVLLTSIGEAKVNSLGSGLEEEALAESIIDETSRVVQLMGWSWNTEKGFIINPDQAGFIYLPSNVLRCDFRNTSLVARGLRVYDTRKHSYVLDGPVSVDMTVGLSWEELPEAIRSYVTYRAGRVFQARQVGSPIIHQFTQEDEQRAWAVISSAEVSVSNLSLFHNRELQVMLDGRPSSGLLNYPAGGLGGSVYD